MSKLFAVQRDFQAYLLAPGPDQAIERQVVNNTRGTAAKRLKVYAEAYRLRLDEALSTDYEALHTLLGDEQFHRLCLKYIDAYPSRHYSLRYFGQHMQGFLNRREPYSRQPVLSELAEFEWAMVNAFDAEDSPVVTPREIANLARAAWPGMRLEFHASLCRLQLVWNSAHLWKVLLSEGNPPDALQRAETSVAWLIWRQDKTYFRSLAPQEAWALDAMRAGADFAKFCEGLCAWVAEEQAALTAAEMLYRWASDGLIKRLVVLPDFHLARDDL